MTENGDAAASLERKLVDLIAGLNDDELAVFHTMVHLAGDSDDVAGFAVLQPLPKGGDPCDGGEIYDPKAFALVSSLHLVIHQPPLRRAPV